jgi:ATP-dependent exoDNAse (exonuclease V) beta subunit
MFVEAGAGTGKTTMLVERIVSLITSRHARMDEIAAITFTEAAAAELRDRLVQAFEKLSASAPTEPVTAALDALDSAAVTTLHGFARRILLEHPFAVGLPPVFEVADASSSRVEFDERWELFVTGLVEDPQYEELVVRALSCGMRWDHLRTAGLTCAENWDRLSRLPIGTPAPPIDSGTLITHAESAMSLRHVCLQDDDRLAVHLDSKVAASLVTLRGADGPIDVLQILQELPKLSFTGGKAENWKAQDGTPRKNDVVEYLRLAQKERERVVQASIQWVLGEFLGLIVGHTLEGATARRVAGRLDFHDLLVLARQLVRDDADARRQLHERYTHLLIDEFQDTDPIQAEIAMYLAAGPRADGAEVEWDELKVDPGRLFFVGDPKQSIYRFRRADIEIFNRTRDQVIGFGRPLVTNFRSRPLIVSFLNTVFPALFASEPSQIQATYVPLADHGDQGRDNGRGLKPVIVLGQSPIDANADGVRAVQALEVVQAIATMHAEHWLVRHGKKEPTPLKLSDVALLVPSRTAVPALEEAFRAADIPYRLESSSLVFASQEVRELLALLRAVDDPTDAVSVLAALRSPAFGCGDDDLYRHAANGGEWDPRQVDEAVDPVTSGLVALRRYHEMRWWSGVGALLSHVVTDRRLMSLALAEPRPRETWRRIRYLLDQARAFDEVSGGDLRAFLRWLGHQQDDESRVTEVVLPESDDDAVRISTIHAAKGLEFPVTVLVGLQRPLVARRPTILFGPSGPELHMSTSFTTPGFEEAFAKEKDMDLAEETRLLYVAATRATDVLVVSLHRGTRNVASLAQQLAAECEKHPDEWSDGSELCVPISVRPAAPPESTDDRADGDRDAFILRRTELLRRAGMPRTVAATGVARLAGSAVEDAPEVSDQEKTATVERRGRAGTAVGRAVHGVLQLVDLETGDGLDNLAQAQALVEGVADRVGEVSALVTAALESELVQRAVSGGRYWREVYVGVPVGERVLEGFIDLLFETPEGLYVVDYKTDRLFDDEDAVLKAQHYELQGASYATAIRAVLHRPIAGCAFLFLDSSGAVAVPIADIDAAMAEVDRILAVPGG